MLREEVRTMSEREYTTEELVAWLKPDARRGGAQVTNRLTRAAAQEPNLDGIYHGSVTGLDLIEWERGDYPRFGEPNWKKDGAVTWDELCSYERRLPVLLAIAEQICPHQCAEHPDDTWFCVIRPLIEDCVGWYTSKLCNRRNARVRSRAAYDLSVRVIEAAFRRCRCATCVGDREYEAGTGKREQVSKRLRFAVLARDKFRCVYCGATPDVTELHVDHIHPVARGGSNAIGNLVTACRDCNLGKTDKLIDQGAMTL
jgi:hypothetical protein